MALDITLKSNTYISLEEAADYIGIKPDKVQENGNKVKRLINFCTDMIEKYINGPVLTRSFTEQRDGDASNTIVPDYYPVRSIEEIRIDYNGDFTQPTSIIDPKYLSIRGMPDLAIGIRGTDVVIRNDGNTSIVGRLFIGSVVNSIQIKYKAGHGETPAELPEDLKYATLMAIEYFYILRENRELGITSKSQFQGQSYARETGLPEEITMLLDPYVDVSLGHTNRPQRNTFTT